MVIDQILFSSVSRESSSKKNTSLLRDTARFVERSKGIQKIFDIGVCGFSWALLAPFSSEARPFLEQGRCIAHICKSTFRFPDLVMQGHQIWNRGEQVKNTTLSVAKKLKKEPLEKPALRRIAFVTKDVFEWSSRFVSWGCRMLSFANKKDLQQISVNFPDQIAHIGVNAGLASVGISFFNTHDRLITALKASEPKNRLLAQAHASTVRQLMFEATSFSSRFFSLVLTWLRLSALCSAMPIITLVTSTVSLSFGLAASKARNQAAIDFKRVNLVI